MTPGSRWATRWPLTDPTASTASHSARSLDPGATLSPPYLYVILDRRAGTILFIRRVTDPFNTIGMTPELTTTGPTR